MIKDKSKYKFENKPSRLTFDMEKLRKQDLRNIMIPNKVRTQVQIINQVKFDSIFPYYGYELPCQDLMLKDYCCYQHNRYARRARRLANELANMELSMTTD